MATGETCPMFRSEEPNSVEGECVCCGRQILYIYVKNFGSCPYCEFPQHLSNIKGLTRSD